MCWNDRANGGVMRSTIQLGQGEGGKERKGKEGNQNKKTPDQTEGISKDRRRKGPAGPGIYLRRRTAHSVRVTR